MTLPHERSFFPLPIDSGPFLRLAPPLHAVFKCLSFIIGTLATFNRKRPYQTQLDTDLLDSARLGSKDGLLSALKKGANPNYKSHKEQTALHYAAMNGHLDCVRILIPLSTPDAPDAYGRTPIHRATENGYFQCVVCLLTVSNTHIKDANDWSLLHWAARYGHTECVSLLLTDEHCHARNNRGDSALHLAAQYGHSVCVSLLLPFSPFEALNHSQQTPQQLARQNQHDHCSALIEAFSLSVCESHDLESAMAPPAPAASRQEARPPSHRVRFL